MDYERWRTNTRRRRSTVRSPTTPSSKTCSKFGWVQRMALCHIWANRSKDDWKSDLIPHSLIKTNNKPKLKDSWPSFHKFSHQPRQDKRLPAMTKQNVLCAAWVAVIKYQVMLSNTLLLVDVLLVICGTNLRGVIGWSIWDVFAWIKNEKKYAKQLLKTARRRFVLNLAFQHS